MIAKCRPNVISIYHFAQYKNLVNEFKSPLFELETNVSTPFFLEIYLYISDLLPTKICEHI